MELKDLFTYHEESRNLYDKFLKVFKLSVSSSSRNSIAFINKDTKVEIGFYFTNKWIKYSIRYYDKNKDIRRYVYNYFWNRKVQTEFYFIGGESNDIDYYIINYVNPHWFCVSLLKFCSVLCSKEVADVIGTNYFIDKYDDLDEKKYSEDKIIFKNIGGKYMFCINVLGNSTVEQLKDLGYYCTTDNETLMIFEHEENKVEIIIKQNNGNYTLNFEDNKGEKFLKSDWYLGNKDGVCCVDIFAIMQKPEFKEFCKCEQQAVIDENEDKSLLEKTWHWTKDDKKISAINKFFIVSEVEKFEQIIQKHGFMKLNINDDGTIDIINDDINLTLRLFLNGSFVWIKDLLWGIQNCIGDVAEEKAEGFEKTLSSIIFSYRQANIRIHKGTEPKLTPEQQQDIKDYNNHDEKLNKDCYAVYDDTKEKIKEICDNISDLLIYKNQKYGNSALEPQNIFYKGDTENALLIRLDDKIGRIINNTDGIRVNDVCDIIGYLVLYLVYKKISKQDIEKLKD